MSDTPETDVLADQLQFIAREGLLLGLGQVLLNAAERLSELEKSREDCASYHHPRCDDCGRKYGDQYGFPDLVVPNDVWKKLAPRYVNGGGLLCPSCMCRRAAELGLENVPATFRSGPFCLPEET